MAGESTWTASRGGKRQGNLPARIHGSPDDRGSVQNGEETVLLRYRSGRERAHCAIKGRARCVFCGNAAEVLGSTCLSRFAVSGSRLERIVKDSLRHYLFVRGTRKANRFAYRAACCRSCKRIESNRDRDSLSPRREQGWEAWRLRRWTLAQTTLTGSREAEVKKGA